MTTSIARLTESFDDLKATPSNILEAAIEEFANASYDSVGMRQIAKRAGCASSLIVRHFGTKQNLFRAVLARTFASFVVAEGESVAVSLQRRASLEAMTHGAASTLAIALRSIGNREAAPIIREYFDERFIGPMSKLVDGAHSDERARLAAAILVGIQVVNMLYVGSPAADVELPGDGVADVFRFVLEGWSPPSES